MHPDLKPTIQLRASTAIIYNKWTGGRKKFNHNTWFNGQRTEVINFENKKAYSGELTDGAIKRMSKALNLFIECTPERQVFSPVFNRNIKHKLSFITLTIPTAQKIELKTATKLLLEPLLKHLRQVHGMTGYVWKVELQERGQLHYHIVSDVYIHYQHLRNKWNSLLAKSGFMNEYIAEHQHQDPNSTDIHSVKKIRDLASYLLKYFTKKSQNPEGLKGKVWDCSKNLKVAKYFETDLTEDLEYDIFRLRELQRAVIKHKESFSFVKFVGMKSYQVFPVEVREAYHKHLFDIRNGTPDLFNSSKKRTQKEDTMYRIEDRPKIMPKYEQLIFNFN